MKDDKSDFIPSEKQGNELSAHYKQEPSMAGLLYK
jgi:hypothetical protein